ncbi:ABC transporter ATP-binding protein [Prauserella flavalba]|uniref:Multidrug ABC transporter ATP-binding protein n=1 Tax=Prauserella flavalba TaxID=1477506 RepID=A0A318LPR2_9PSEU|nr:ABC transporter ATP-binding protein [Prauserella flavalba]PXY36513.1 multidrug ABC transporter ATP-binding protein [Prauserella flavalba]
MSTALLVEGLRKCYGAVVAVDDVGFDVAEGEIFGLIGPNGSGKTTTAECAQALRRPDSGRVRVFGVDPHEQRGAVRRLIGSQLQESTLPDRITVGEAVHLFASLAPDPVDEPGLIAEWGLSAKRGAAFSSLSGGQRQRLFVALALVSRPRLVFLDEMTTGLDPAARREAWRLIERVRADGATIVLVTHFMDEVERLCDRVAVLVNGRIVEVDTPAGLIERRGGGSVVRLSAPAALDTGGLRALPGVADVTCHDGVIEVRGSARSVTALGHWLVVRGYGDTGLRVSQGSLEDAYLSLVAAAREES